MPGKVPALLLLLPLFERGFLSVPIARALRYPQFPLAQVIRIVETFRSQIRLF
jgi:hypothetical protein